jgi:NADPH:quinone reductase-like Zn-dependent oxidoreductase
MIEHKNMLQKIAAVVDDGRIRSTVTTTVEDFSAAGLRRRAHEMVESGRSVGKVVVR